MKSVPFESLRDDLLQDNELRREHDRLEEGFQLAKEVIALRIASNLTQKQLAERMGTSQPAIARLESGNYRNLSLAFLRRLGDALGAVPEVHLRKVSS